MHLKRKDIDIFCTLLVATTYHQNKNIIFYFDGKEVAPIALR